MKQEPGGGYEGDVSGLYNEIYEKLLIEHAEQAELMLSRASEEARDIIENAKKQAAEIVALAKTEALNLRDGLKAQAEREAAERKHLEEQELLRMESSLRCSYDALVDGIRGEAITLVMEIVRKIIGVKLAQSDEVFLGLVRDALERLRQTGSVVIRVSCEDYARYFGHEHAGQDLGAGETKVAIVEEQDFGTGDLIVESEGEVIDLSVGRQIAQIEKAFLS
jgi:flagellar assembly protein FliH